MKMNKKSHRCLSAGLLACVPAVSQTEFRATNTSAAPAIPAAALQQLTWTPVDQSKTQSTQLSMGGQQLNVPKFLAPLRLISVPANIGE